MYQQCLSIQNGFQGTRRGFGRFMTQTALELFGVID